jgi:hypothetical protein
MERLVGAHASDDRASQVAIKLGCALPFVMQSVDVSNGDLRKLFVGDIGKASKIDSVHLPDRRFVPDTETTNSTVLAEVVMVLFCVEQILCQLRLAGQQTEAFRFGHGGPEAVAPAYGAITAIRALRKVEVCLEGDGTAMTTTPIRLQHDEVSLD